MFALCLEFRAMIKKKNKQDPIHFFFLVLRIDSVFCVTGNIYSASVPIYASQVMRALYRGENTESLRFVLSGDRRIINRPHIRFHYYCTFSSRSHAHARYYYMYIVQSAPRGFNCTYRRPARYRSDFFH